MICQQSITKIREFINNHTDMVRMKQFSNRVEYYEY